MRHLLIALASLVMTGCAATADRGPDWHLIPGGFEPGRQPDGNSIFLDAPEGLILVDTGRHREHQEKLLAFARERGRPIAATPSGSSTRSPGSTAGAAKAAASASITARSTNIR